MEEFLQILIDQNAQILATLEYMAGKLDVLDDIQQAINSLETSIATMESIPAWLGSDISDIKDGISSVHEELQWHKNLSSAAQIIKAVEDVTEAIRELR